MVKHKYHKIINTSWEVNGIVKLFLNFNASKEFWYTLCIKSRKPTAILYELHDPNKNSEGKRKSVVGTVDFCKTFLFTHSKIYKLQQHI